MAKSIKAKDVKGDIDKMFEKLSPASARRIDNGGTKPKSKAKSKKK